MAWEIKGGCRFYTRSRRVNGVVRRQYIGTGLIAELAAREDEERRQRASAERERLQRQQEAFNAAAAPHERLSTIADALMRAALVDAGYGRHDPGHWRKRRDFTERE